MPRIALPRIALTVALASILASCSNAAGPAGAPLPSDAGSPSPTASASAAATPSGTIGTLAPSSPAANASPASRPSGSGTTFPAPGEYVYAQSGSETLCSSTACGTPRPLPDRMYATVTHGGRSNGADAVTFEFRIAQGRTIRVDTRFSESVATLHRFRAELTEAGITQSESIEPAPPMTLMRFPLTAGKRWSGKFTDGDSSGDYQFRVAGLETIEAAGSRVRAWKIEGSIEASGDGEATVALTTWIDPETRTFVRLTGSIDATYDLARYKASFTETLATAPS